MSRGARWRRVGPTTPGALLSNPDSLYDNRPDYLPWMSEAKCSELLPDGEYVYDPEWWFPPRDKSLYKPIADKAKGICYGRDGRGECPVRKECLLFADENEYTHGIFGGMSHRERAALKRKAERQGSTLENLAFPKTRQSK